MNKKSWLIIGVVILVALGIWYYFDSRESVGLAPPVLDLRGLEFPCDMGDMPSYRCCISNCETDLIDCLKAAITDYGNCEGLGCSEFYDTLDRDCLRDFEVCDAVCYFADYGAGGPSYWDIIRRKS